MMSYPNATVSTTVAEDDCNTVGLVLIVRIFELRIVSFYCVRNHWKRNQILFIA